MSLYEPVIKAAAPLVKLYHRLEVHGIENLPPEGKGFILTPNHTNWFGWDAFVISCALKGRKARWLSWSYGDEIPGWDAIVSAFDAILYNKEKPFQYDEISREILEPGGIVGIFPEGNNNTVADWYRLRPFFPGCIRLAAISGAPIVPVAVAGIEEASPIFKAKENEGEPITDIVALPMVLPAKAHVCFGKPVYPNIARDELDDRDALKSEAKKIQLSVLNMLKKFRPGARAE